MAKHVALMCTNCRGKLVRDPSGDTWHCEHCGTEYERDEIMAIIEVRNAQKLGEEFGRGLMNARREGAGQNTKTHSTKTLVLAVLVTAVVVGLATRMTTPSPGQIKPQYTEMGAQDKGTEPSEDSLSDKNTVADTATTDGEQEGGNGESTTDASKSTATTEGNSKPSSKYAELIGTWQGELQPSPEEIYCYGAESMPLVLTVKEATNLDKVTADIHVCQHNHYNLENSASTTEGDEYLELNNVIMKYNDGELKYEYDFDRKYADTLGPQLIRIEFHVSELKSGTPRIDAEVCSMYGEGMGYDTTQQIDRFGLEKIA